MWLIWRRRQKHQRCQATGRIEPQVQSEAQFICGLTEGWQGNPCNAIGKKEDAKESNAGLHESILAQMFCLSRQNVRIIRTEGQVGQIEQVSFRSWSCSEVLDLPRDI